MWIPPLICNYAIFIKVKVCYSTPDKDSEYNAEIPFVVLTQSFQRHELITNFGAQKITPK